MFQDDIINAEVRDNIEDVLENVEDVLENVEEANVNRVMNEKMRTLDDFMQSEDFFQRIDTPMDKTKGELFLMLLKFSLTSSLTLTNMTNLFKLFNFQFLEPVLPDSHYMLNNLLNPEGGTEFHAVCPHCSAYIGKFEEVKCVKNCRVCGGQLDLLNACNVSYFVIINPARQISHLLNIYENHYDYVMKERNYNVDKITDVHDGNAYRKFRESLPVEAKNNYVSSILNTDGTRKFECSDCSLWPIFLMLNELPIEARTKNLITCGLWFAKKKPDMNAFLNPFLDVVDELRKEGISCKIKGETRLIKLYIPESCVDAVARAPMQGIHQFNGECGCSWCLHRGQFAEGAWRYPLEDQPSKLRDAETTMNAMLTATPERHIDGVIGPTPLATLEEHDIVFGVLPDYLHCGPQGVIKQFIEYYATTMDAEEVDSIMMSITASHQMAHLTRPFSSRANWSARDRENFALYYSIPIFSRKLSKEWFHHWLLLVESLYILLQESIDVAELDRADEMLHEFVGKAQGYFGIKAMKYNVHQMLHIGRSVLDWGPLWAHSTFAFEAGNHYILRATKCARGVTQQIVRYVNLQHNISLVQERVYPRASNAIKFYCDDVLADRAQNVYQINGRTYFGRGYMGYGILQDLNLPDTSMLYAKMVKDSCLYQTSMKKNKRSNDSAAQLTDSRFIRILCFIVDSQTKQEITVCNLLHTHASFGNKYKVFQTVDAIEETNTIIPTGSIKTICNFMNVFETMYVCPPPNLVKY